MNSMNNSQNKEHKTQHKMSEHSDSQNQVGILKTEEEPPKIFGLYIPPKKSQTPQRPTATSSQQQQKKKKTDKGLVIPMVPNTFLPFGSTKRGRTESVEANDEIKQQEDHSPLKRQKLIHDTDVDVNDEMKVAEHLLKRVSQNPNYLNSTGDDEEENVFDRAMKDDNHEFSNHRIGVKDIGKALLRGMGWVEGTPYGRGEKQFEALEEKARPRLAGLGSLVEVDPADNTDSAPSRKPKSMINPKPLPAREEEQEKEVKKPSPITWVIPGIRVRIISKSYDKGKYYNTKGDVLDVPDRYTCTVQVPDSSGRQKILDNITESMLETIIPRDRNTGVICVGGRHKGKSGRMVERDSKRQTLTFRVTDEGDEDYGQFFTVHYDDICERSAE